MSSLDDALNTQLANIEKKTGKSLQELAQAIHESGLAKHGEMRSLAMEQFELGYGDANSLVHYARKLAEGEDGGDPTLEDEVARIYSGKKEELLPIHQDFMTMLDDLGEIELSPKKAYISLRSKKQFATVGPASKGRVEIGLNLDDPAASDRLEELGPGKMCSHRVFLSGPSDVDDELAAWVRAAYESAG